MTRDIASIARSLGGRTIEGRLDAGLRVDAVVALDDFSVVGHPSFATLVVASARAATAALAPEAERREALQQAVIVAHGEDARLLAALKRTGTTAIVGTEVSDELLGPVLTALLAVDQAAEDRAVTSAMKVLTLAARRGGVSGVVAELAHRIDGWVVLLDRHGQVITSAGAGGLHVQDAMAVALSRPVRVRHRALQVHVVGSGEDLSARLVVSPRTESSSRARELGSQAAALLDLLLRTDDPSRTGAPRACPDDRRPARRRSGRRVIAAQVGRARDLAHRLRPHRPVRLGGGRTAGVALALTSSAPPTSTPSGTASSPASCATTRWMPWPRAWRRTPPPSSSGSGTSAPTDALAPSAAEAGHAVESARAEESASCATAPSRPSRSCSTASARTTRGVSPGCSTPPRRDRTAR
ncbi:PucR family transcriptional regulator [Leifsonia sp. L25]|uniref:PucR family transcriptional regulator n=1 Tax=Leifsonia sp. L25 TaxID=3423957 RepID=UPI003D6872C6